MGKRCVVTSSIAAVGPGMDWIMNPSKADNSKVFDEADWNTDSTLQNGAYRLSKYLAEQKAWELDEGNARGQACAEGLPLWPCRCAGCGPGAHLCHGSCGGWRQAFPCNKP